MILLFTVVWMAIGIIIQFFLSQKIIGVTTAADIWLGAVAGPITDVI